jgi:nicotinamide mononucleotide transporter
VRHATRAEGLAAVVSVAALFGLILPVLGWARGSVPVFDATITALSVVAQVMLNTRRVESWYVWVLVDLVSVPVYVVKGLYLIALLYLVFLGLAVRGAWEWRREARGA